MRLQVEMHQQQKVKRLQHQKEVLLRQRQSLHQQRQPKHRQQNLQDIHKADNQCRGDGGRQKPGDSPFRARGLGASEIDQGNRLEELMVSFSEDAFRPGLV